MAKTQAMAQGIRIQAAVATAISGQEILDSSKFATKLSVYGVCKAGFSHSDWKNFALGYIYTQPAVVMVLANILCA